MTIAEPIPDLQWGKGAWQDYISNWRTRDTNWMQERLILRYQTAALRSTDWPAPRAGQVTFNEQTGLLEMWSQAKTAWLRSLMFQFLMSNKDDSAGVSLYHSGSGAKGVVLGPGVASAGSLAVDVPTNFLNGVGLLDATGFALKIGTKTAKLTTDATALVSDSPIKAPSVAADTAAFTGAVSAGSLAAASATITTALTLTGATVSGGILNPASAAINGVQIGNAPAHGAGGVRANAQGFSSGNGSFRGDGSGAIMQYRTEADGGFGSAYLQVTAGLTNVAGDMYINTGYLRIMGGRGIPWHNAAGTHTAWISPCIYSGGDPGAGNFPDGTIWIQ